MFIAALFTKAKIRNLPKFLPTNEWMKEMCYYIYNRTLFSLKKKKDGNPIIWSNMREWRLLY
jgi:hypothetical protein